MSDICGDNRFQIIANAKKQLLEATDIETSQDEMKVIDNILFRMWQMEWLPTNMYKLVHCEDCKFAHGDFRNIKCRMNFDGNGDEREVSKYHFCAYGEKQI